MEKKLFEFKIGKLEVSYWFSLIWIGLPFSIFISDDHDTISFMFLCFMKQVAIREA
jgi:hypothetical protein